MPKHLLAWIAGCIAVAGGATRTVAAEDSDLAGLLTTFFRAETPEVRGEVRKKILAIPGLDHRRLDVALANLDLWPDAPQGENPLKLELGQNSPLKLDVYLRLPPNYTGKRAWPMLILVHGQGGKAPQMLAHARDWLGEQEDEFIVAAPQDIDGPGFSGPPDMEMRPRQLLIALRKRFHLDNDRVFITGYSLGGHRAWLSAVLHADCFAGAMPLAGVLILPGGDVLTEDVVQNLRQLPLLCVWGEKDLGEEDGKAIVNSGIAGGNNRTFKIAKALGLTRLVGIQVAGLGHLGVAPPEEARAKLFESRRVHFPKQVHQAFRLAQTSQAYWVRTQALQGSPLPGIGEKQIRAPVGPDEDPQEALARYLRKGIGIIDAQVRGQSIELQTQKSKFVELLLHEDLLDLDQPIIVTRNKHKVFEGTVARSLGVTLDEAAREWDFQRLPMAMLTVPSGGKAKVAQDHEPERGRIKQSK